MEEDRKKEKAIKREKMNENELEMKEEVKNDIETEE